MARLRSSADLRAAVRTADFAGDQHTIMKTVLLAPNMRVSNGHRLCEYGSAQI